MVDNTWDMTSYHTFCNISQVWGIIEKYWNKCCLRLHLLINSWGQPCKKWRELSLLPQTPLGFMRPARDSRVSLSLWWIRDIQIFVGMAPEQRQKFCVGKVRVSLVSCRMLAFPYSPPPRPSVTATANSQFYVHPNMPPVSFTWAAEHCQTKVTWFCKLVPVHVFIFQLQELPFAPAPSVSLIFACLSSSEPFSLHFNVSTSDSFPALPV